MSLHNLTSFDTQNLIYLLLLLALIGSTVLRGGMGFAKIVKYLALWAVIAGVGVILYAYRFEFSDFKTRILGELSPASAVVNDEKQIVIALSQDGHFYMDVKVNGVPVRFMVDTGASNIVISKSEAQRVGINLRELVFNEIYQTANGVAYGASVRLKKLEVGNVKFVNVGASVNSAEMGVSLLGMSFLRQFKKYEVSRDRLVLTI